MKTISIIGLGWLGLPLAHYLSQQNFKIKGSVTSQEKLTKLQHDSFTVRKLVFNPHPEGENFHTLFDTDILIVNIPPKSQTLGENYHPEQIKYIKTLAHQSHIKKIIFVSSTSVYPSAQQIAFEKDELSVENTGNKAIYRAEQLIQNDSNFDWCIIRFGGLMGQQRIPGKYFSNKQQVVGDHPVNYIHQVDAIRMIHWVISNDLWQEIYNGVAPEHPKRADIYEKNALDYGFPPPLSYASSSLEPTKTIDSSKIIATGFSFAFPNPLDFPYQPILS